MRAIIHLENYNITHYSPLDNMSPQFDNFYNGEVHLQACNRIGLAKWFHLFDNLSWVAWFAIRVSKLYRFLHKLSALKERSRLIVSLYTYCKHYLKDIQGGAEWES